MASSLLQDEPEGPAHGFLAFLDAVMCLDTGNLDGCLEAAGGRRFEVPDLEALGATFQGCALVRRASLPEDLGLLDEGMGRATTGRLSPLATGLIYCRTIWICVELCDHRRADEWIAHWRPAVPRPACGAARVESDHDRQRKAEHKALRESAGERAEYLSQLLHRRLPKASVTSLVMRAFLHSPNQAPAKAACDLLAIQAPSVAQEHYGA